MKSKFNKGQKVSFTHKGKLYRGVVSGVKGRRRIIRTDNGEELNIIVNLLKRARDSVLILESRLDRSLRSTRTYGEMMVQALHAYNIEAIYEKIHTKQGLKRFIKEECRRRITLRIIHIISHGISSSKKNNTKLELTFENIDLKNDHNIFENLEGKIIIFSSCEVGRDIEVLKTLVKKSNARAIFAYNLEVEDWYTNIAEFLIYDRLFNTSWTPRKIAEKVARSLETAGIRPESGAHSKKPVLICVTKNGVFPPEKKKGQTK